ncbi:MAG: polysaccharide biosynthesis protein [Planctomycetes bacterium]|nr:polysaccharide biosynthesis protein [Planctomycetota bacterium]
MFITPPANPSPNTPTGPRTLIIGTALSVQQWVHALTILDPPPVMVGCVLPRASLTAAHPPTTILGDIDELERVLAGVAVDQVIVSLPLVMAEQARRVGETLDRLGVTWRSVQTLSDQLAGRTPPPRIHTNVGPSGERVNLTASIGGPCVDPVLLLNRRSHSLDEGAIRRTLGGRVVLITGSGGSIGSELAKIVARFAPSRLVLVERSENALFEIDRQIARTHPTLPRSAVLHDVTNAPRTQAVVMAHKPAVIFHAAAHKHVPMMEDHPSDAVENNFFGTRSIADAAAANAVDRFVMISTDKAVNPSSVMGATKRLAELYIQYLNRRSDTNYSMVRFGNVLGSACSVLPIWAQQIMQGHAVTVTHPDMSRYFMTIPEAAGLVLQSAALSNSDGGGGGEVFLLDMGEPIRILDLARRFIRLQGLEPDADVPIEFTGIRPGEKLFEELAYGGEDMIPTPHRSVRIWRTTPPEAARMREIIALFDRLRSGDGSWGHPWQHTPREAILAALRDAVPEMVAPASSPTSGVAKVA